MKFKVYVLCINMAEKPKRVYKNEEETRRIFERLLGVRMNKVRGLFSNKLLELDGYSDCCGPHNNIKIGFEYQGKQHYKYIPYFHGEDPDKTREKLWDQQKRDQQKRDECEKLGIFLIEVPCYVTNKEEFISRELHTFFDSKGIDGWECVDFEADWWNEEDEEEGKIYTCEYCKHSFINMSNLNQHQKTARYCLALRNKINSDFSCKYCNQIFTQKNRLNNHQENCSSKNVCSDYNNQISKLTSTISDLQKKLDELLLKNTHLEQTNQNLLSQLNEEKQAREKHQVMIEDLLRQSIKTPNITNNTQNNIQINAECLIMDSNIMTQKIQENLTLRDATDGPIGLARFTHKNLLTDKDGNNMYPCTNHALKMFRYRDKSGKVQKDPQATKLWSYIGDPLINRSMNEIICEIDKSTDTDKKHILLQKGANIKRLKENNSKFIKSLAEISALSSYS